MNKIINLYDTITLLDVITKQREINDALNDEKIEKITFQIASGGGDVAASASLFYWLESLDKDKLEIVAFSHLASAANLFLLTKHPTYCYPHCSFMFHLCDTNVTVSAKSEIPIVSNCQQRLEDYWNIYSDKTNGKINRKWIKKKEHTYLYPKELIELNILDGVIGETR